MPYLISSGRGVTGDDNHGSIGSTSLFPVFDLPHIDVLKLRHGDALEIVAGVHNRHDTVIGNRKRNRVLSLIHSKLYLFWVDEWLDLHVWNIQPFEFRVDCLYEYA